MGSYDNQHIVAALLRHLYFFDRRWDIALKKEWVQAWKMGGGKELEKGGKWINHGKVYKMLCIQKLYLNFWKLDEKPISRQ